MFTLRLRVLSRWVVPVQRSNPEGESLVRWKDKEGRKEERNGEEGQEEVRDVWKGGRGEGKDGDLGGRPPRVGRRWWFRRGERDRGRRIWTGR